MKSEKIIKTKQVFLRNERGEANANSVKMIDKRKNKEGKK